MPGKAGLSSGRGLRALHAAVAAVVVALLIPSAAAAVSWDPSDHPAVSGRTQVFHAIEAAGRNDVWAIGYSWGFIGSALEFRTLAQRWNGAAWERVPTPDVETAPSKSRLYDADVVGRNNVWAAGASATAPGNAASKPLVLRWNGTEWSIVPLPATPPGSSFSAIAATASSVWGVGEKYNPLSGYWQPFVLRREGGTWAEVPFPATTGCRAASDGTFWRYSPGGVTVRDNGDVYVSGACASEVGDRAVLGLYRDGRWRSAFDPTTLPATSHLSDVDAQPGRAVRAVGGDGTSPLILKGGGIKFTREPAPSIGRGLSLHAVTSGAHPYATGVVSRDDAWAHPAVLRFGNGQWHSEPVSIDYGNPFGVTYDPSGQPWVAGVSVTDDYGLILRRNLTR